MEGDGDELGDSDCLPRLRTKWPHVRIRTPSQVILCAHANPPRRLFKGGVYFTQRLRLCGVYSRAASIRGRRLFAEIW